LAPKFGILINTFISISQKFGLLQLRPCEKNHIKEDYCIHHRSEESRMWDKALNELGEKVCALHPFICELC
jgi:hypothetical protein